jgi:hypothetical protein
MVVGPIQFSVSTNPIKLFKQGVVVQQKIPAGAMVNSDGEVVGKATTAQATAYLNGVPVGVLTNIEYGDATVMNPPFDKRKGGAVTPVKIRKGKRNVL